MAGLTCPFNGHGPCRADCALRLDLDYIVSKEHDEDVVTRRTSRDTRGLTCAVTRIASAIEEKLCRELLEKHKAKRDSWF